MESRGKNKTQKEEEQNRFRRTGKRSEREKEVKELGEEENRMMCSRIKSKTGRQRGTKIKLKTEERMSSQRRRKEIEVKEESDVEKSEK